jgi:hypothetical protein
MASAAKSTSECFVIRPVFLHVSASCSRLPIGLQAEMLRIRVYDGAHNSRNLRAFGVSSDAEAGTPNVVMSYCRRKESATVRMGLG